MPGEIQQVAPEAIVEINDNVEIPASSTGADIPAFSLDDLTGGSSTAGKSEPTVSAATKDSADKVSGPADKVIKPPINKPKAEDETPEEEPEDAEDETENSEKDGKDKTAKEPDEVEETDDEVDADGKPKIHGNNKRNFDGLTPEEIKLLKRVDNKRFEGITARIKELKAEASKAAEYQTKAQQLEKTLREGGVPDSWVEHPESYKLSPAYQQVSSRYDRLAFEEEHYRQQLIRVRNGEDWQTVSFDQQGNPILSQPHKASNEADVNLTSHLAKAGNLRSQLEQQANQIASTFKQNHQRDAEGVKQGVDQVVKGLIKELQPIEADINDIRGKLPASLKNSPFAYGYEQMYSVICQQARMLNKLTTENKQKQKLQADKKLAGANTNKLPKDPSSSRKGGNGELLDLSVLMGNNG